MRSLFKHVLPISTLRFAPSRARLGRCHFHTLETALKTPSIRKIPRFYDKLHLRKTDSYKDPYIRKTDSYEDCYIRKTDSYEDCYIRKIESYEDCYIRKIVENTSHHPYKCFQKGPEITGEGWIHVTSPKPPIQNEEILVKVNIGLRNAVNVCLRQPPRQEADNPIIIFLRRGIPDVRQDESWRQSLALGANAIVVEISFPVSPMYPLPIHTVLAGFDWARKNLTANGTIFNPTRVMTNKPPKIGVCGELVGGGLATMLALTEGIGESPNPKLPGISALAVGNPILDWTTLTQTDSDGVVVRPLSVSGLLATRTSYFPTPETYFDPFASPLLFFRTPSSEIPNDSRAPNEHGLPNGDPEDENSLSQPVKKRRSARKYPPAGSNLILPWTKVEVGKDWVLKDQGADLIEMMRKSHKRSEAERPAEATNPVKREFEVMEREGLGLWDEKDALEIGQWFGEVLKEPE